MPRGVDPLAARARRWWTGGAPGPPRRDIRLRAVRRACPIGRHRDAVRPTVRSSSTAACACDGAGPRRSTATVRSGCWARPSGPAPPAWRATTASTGSSLGRMLLRDLAADAGGVPAEQVAVEAACERCGLEHGRPRLRWPDAAGPAPSVGLASCDGLVVAALAPPGVAVGIDVERPRAATTRGAEAERRDAVALPPRRPAPHARSGAGCAPRPCSRPTAAACASSPPTCASTATARASPTGPTSSGSSIAGSTDASSASPSRAARPSRDRPRGRERGQRRVVEPGLEERREVAMRARGDEGDEVRGRRRDARYVRAHVRSSAEERVVAEGQRAGRAASARRACRRGRRTCGPGRGRPARGPAEARRAARGGAAPSGGRWGRPRPPTTATRRSTRIPR